MPRPFDTTQLDDAITFYESCQVAFREVVSRFRVPRTVLKRRLQERGTWRSRSESGKGRTSPNKRDDLDTDSICARYQQGESQNSIAQAWGVTRRVIRRVLESNNVPIRGSVQANQVMMSQRSETENRHNTHAAHEAARGRERSFGEACRMAQGRQRSLAKVSPLEAQVCEWLTRRSVPLVQQQAIGPYNCDIAAGSVAVEVFGGNWHDSGQHRAVFPKRARYILDQGWLLVIVWVIRERPLRPELGEYLASLYEIASSDPSVRGQYRVVWGTGEDATVPGLDLDQLARPPARHGSGRFGT